MAILPVRRGSGVGPLIAGFKTVIWTGDIMALIGLRTPWLFFRYDRVVVWDLK